MNTPDVWLRPAQAVYLLMTGDLAEASHLTDAAVTGMAVLIPLVSVPLSPNAGRRQRAAALKRTKELASEAGDSPSSIAARWCDHLLETGQVPAVGRRRSESQLQPIIPAEFAAGLRLAGPHALARGGYPAFYDVLLSGAALMAARQAALEASRPGMRDRSLKSAPAPGRARTKRPGPIPTAEAIVNAARQIIAAGRIPGKPVKWEQFREEICKSLKVRPETRGYGLDTIQLAVRPLLKNDNKTETT